MDKRKVIRQERVNPRPDTKEPDPERRRFLRHGLYVGGAALAEGGARAGSTAATQAPPRWMRETGAPFSNYGQPSPHEKAVIRWVSANPAVAGNGVSWSPLQNLAGMVTPNSLHFERHHNGVPSIDPEHHRLVIDGLVERPLSFSVPALLRYPRSSRLCFIECGGNSSAGWQPRPLQARVGHFHGLISCSEWTGVALSSLLREASPARDATWLVAEGADAAAVAVSIPLAKAMDDVLIALYQNGERVRPENGYPMRLLVPGWEGIVNVKWLRRLRLASAPQMTRYETSKYTDLLADGTARQFSFLMGVKSVITHPSPGMELEGAGLYEISGLAWSGAGRIQAVEVSVDGGANWSRARLQGPVLPACLTRFRWSWKWKGRRALLLSRALDEAGNRQPTRADLISRRGEHGYYHYNAMVSWELDDMGEVRHVYL